MSDRLRSGWPEPVLGGAGPSVRRRARGLPETDGVLPPGAGSAPDDGALPGQTPGPASGDTPASGDAPEPAPGGCANCLHCTPFGNCGTPVAAGLSTSFELRAHPSGGAGCPAQSPRHVSGGVAHWRIWHGDHFRDMALCPPPSLRRLWQDHPHATRIEPIAPEDAWPHVG